MKIGVITDIHNNLPALKVMVDELKSRGCESFLCCGDIIGIGPYPEETVEFVRKLPNFTAVLGNHDRYFTEGLPEVFPNEEDMGEGEALHHKWEHSRLSDNSKAYLHSLPLKTELEIEGKKIALMHYSMDENGRYVNFTPDPTAEDLGRMFAGVDADIILYGHDHKPSLVESNGKSWLNPGSLGCPAVDRNIARGLVLDMGDEVKYEEVRVSYDVEKVLNDIDKFAYSDFENIKKYFYGVW